MPLGLSADPFHLSIIENMKFAMPQRITVRVYSKLLSRFSEADIAMLVLAALGLMCISNWCFARQDVTMDHPFTITLLEHPTLFLDDHVIGNTINLKRQVETPRVLSAQGVVGPDHPWEAGHISHPTVLWDPQHQKFRMYYTARGTSEVTEGTGGYVCYAESDDALDWRKPLLDHHPYGEHLKTNIVLNPLGEAMHPFVIRTPHDDKRPFKGVFRKRNTPPHRTGRGLYTVWSSDGLRWSEPNWISRTKCDTPPSLAWIPSLGQYFAYTRAQSYHPKPPSYFRMTGVLQSPDFENWTAKAAINLVSEADGWPYIQNHDLQVCNYGDLMLGFLTVLDVGSPLGYANKRAWRWRSQMATSRDGWQWRPVLNRENLSFWTRGLVVKDDVMYFFNQEFRVKTLPVDRFVGLRQIESANDGVLETRPLRFKGGDLLVNAEVEPGDIQVELIDEQGPVVQHQSKPLEGFERDRSRLIRLDGLRHHVVWQHDGGDKTLADAAAVQPLVIRFILKGGKLFAFRIAD